MFLEYVKFDEEKCKTCFTDGTMVRQCKTKGESCLGSS